MRCLRFVHTSDVHLDTSFAGAGLPARIGNRKREAIRAVFKRIMRDARSLPADLVLIAGDLFEQERITPDTVAFLKQHFEALHPIPVFISPGNHDPYMAGSPYREESWPSNVHIFKEEHFHSVELPEPGIRVTGLGFNRTRVPDRCFRTLPVLPDDCCNIVLAHGSEVGRLPAGQTAHIPFTADEITGKNVAYCALGHYHQQRAVQHTADSTPIWYSGVPEGRGWDEEGDCGYLVGKVEDGAARVTPVVCSRFPFRTMNVDCEGFASREQIVEAVLAKQSGVFDENTILRVRLLGSPDTALDLSVQEITERLSEHVLHLHCDDATQPALDFELLARDRTLQGLFLSDMNSRIAAATADEREVLELARLYGSQALLGREVRLR